MVYLSFFSQIAQWFQTWAANIKIPQVAALVIGIAALLVALTAAKAVGRILLIIAAALGILYFFYPAVFSDVVARAKDLAA